MSALRKKIRKLKWDAIDFERKTLTIKHIVIEATLDGKQTIIEKDRTKTKSSYRSLPLVAPFEESVYPPEGGQQRAGNKKSPKVSL